MSNDLGRPALSITLLCRGSAPFAHHPPRGAPMSHPRPTPTRAKLALLAAAALLSLPAPSLAQCEPQQVIRLAPAPTDSRFGGGVPLSGDGNTLIVGAPADNNAIGAVYFFVRSGATWVPQGSRTLASGEI